MLPVVLPVVLANTTHFTDKYDNTRERGYRSLKLLIVILSVKDMPAELGVTRYVIYYFSSNEVI